MNYNVVLEMSSNVLCYEQEVGCLSDIGWCMTVFTP